VWSQPRNTGLEGGETTTDPHGRFRITRLAPGAMLLIVQKEGYENEWFRDVEVGATGVRLMVAPRAESLPRPQAPKVGAPAPPFQVAQWVNGDGFPSLGALRGRTVLLQLSAAYNAAARDGNALLRELHTELARQGRQDVVIMALYDRSASAEEVAAYARAERLPYPIGIVAEPSGPGRESVFAAWGARQLPALFVIDREGRVRAVNPSREELLRLVDSRKGG
jgi:hypothetical protein